MADAYTRARFKADLQRLGRHQRWFAETVGLSRSTVLRWGVDRTPFPRWVPLLMGAWLENDALGHHLDFALHGF